MESIFFLAFAGFMAFILWSLFSSKGRSRQFGGDFAWSSEPHVIKDGNDGKEVLIIHKVTPSDQSALPGVGLEYRATATLAASMVPILLTREQARQLARDIENAAS